MLDRDLFFGALRKGPLFPHGFSQQQVDGIGRLLDVWYGLAPKVKSVLPGAQAAYALADNYEVLSYDLATSFHETGGLCWPIIEMGSRPYFAKYGPATNLGRMLGNTTPGDEWTFRGMGDVQNTGRRNAAFSSGRLSARFGLAVDFVARPLDRLDPVLSAHCLFMGNDEGWWSGRRLAEYIPQGLALAEANELKDDIAARHVVNGTDKARKIAGYAVIIAKALRDGGVKQ